jgi:hypothetical protein
MTDHEAAERAAQSLLKLSRQNYRWPWFGWEQAPTIDLDEAMEAVRHELHQHDRG